MPPPSKAYLIESALYGEPPTPPERCPANVSGPPTFPDPGDDIPSDYIPGLYSLGATYNVLNGRYADSRSLLHHVVDWYKTESRSQVFGGRQYTIPTVVNYIVNTSSLYRSYHGSTTSEYSNSLSTHAGFDTKFPGFSSSVSTDYSESQRESLSNAFTRIAYNVTHYNLSLPPTSHVKGLLKPWFVSDLDTMDPIALYRTYGTHLLRSMTIGGHALFLYSTDTRLYDAELSIEAAARISASYLVSSGKVELSAAQRKAMQSFNQSSQTTVVTRGGDPKYGNEQFLNNTEKWAESILDFPEFIDFGAQPAFIGLWELASTSERRDELSRVYTVFINTYQTDLTLPAPYLHGVLSKSADPNRIVIFFANGASGFDLLPTPRSDDWYWVTPGSEGDGLILVKELVSGALAPVKWEHLYTDRDPKDEYRTTFWRAIPPTRDYVALGYVGFTVWGKGGETPKEPPTIAQRFRAVHKKCLTGSSLQITSIGPLGRRPELFSFIVDYRYNYVDYEPPRQFDFYVLDPKMTIRDWEGW